MEHKTFPQTLFVKIEKEREPEDDFFIATENYSDLSKPEETVDVAVYELAAIKRVVNKTELII